MTSQPVESGGEGVHGEEVGRVLLVMRHDTAVVFQPVDEPLDPVPLPARYLIKRLVAAVVPPLVVARRDVGGHG